MATMELASIPRELPQFGRHLSSLARPASEVFGRQGARRDKGACGCAGGTGSCKCNEGSCGCEDGGRRFSNSYWYTNGHGSGQAEGQPPVLDSDDSCLSKRCSVEVACQALVPLQGLPEITRTLAGGEVARHCMFVFVDCDGNKTSLELSPNTLFGYIAHLKSGKDPKDFTAAGRPAAQYGGPASMLFTTIFSAPPPAPPPRRTSCGTPRRASCGTPQPSS